jgi:hypothetical protein
LNGREKEDGSTQSSLFSVGRCSNYFSATVKQIRKMVLKFWNGRFITGWHGRQGDRMSLSKIDQNFVKIDTQLLPQLKETRNFGLLLQYNKMYQRNQPPNM